MSMRVLCPSGHLGITPLQEDSFYRGVEQQPDAIIADSGSNDIGPYPLGSNVLNCHSPLSGQRHDLEHMLLAARDLDVPMIVGSASDVGTNKSVDHYIDLIKDIADEHGLNDFKLAYIYSDVEKNILTDAITSGEELKGLNGRPPLTEDDVEQSDNIVALMGVEPIIEALNKDVDVIMAGRSSDVCIFAAPLINAGYPKSLSYLFGKVIECASFCAEPYMGKESVIGEITDDYVCFEPMHPDQKCTPASVASHVMYERADPYKEVLPGGAIELEKCNYQKVGNRKTKITGPKWNPSDKYYVKLEGAGYIGERAVAILGIRDPITINNIDKVIDWAKGQVEEKYDKLEDGAEYQLFFHVYGKNAIMGSWEPKRNATPHEVGVVIEAVASEYELAEEVAHLASRNVFYARLSTVKGTAGGAAYPPFEIMKSQPAYKWIINHVIEVKDPLELFSINTLDIKKR